MGTDIVVKLPPRAEWGPAMRALNTDAQRKFVWGIAELGDDNFCRAARLAWPNQSDGSVEVTAHRYSHDPRILAALHELAVQRINGLKHLAVRSLSDMARNPQHKDHFKAVATILNRTGLHETTEQKILVVHTDRELLEQARAKAEEAGLTREQQRELLGEFEEGVFEEIESTAGIEDLL